MSFESYADQQAIFLEDFDGRMHLSAKALKTITANGRVTLPGRGVSTYARHRWVFITSNRSPEEWGYQDVDVSALQRRFLIEMKADYDHWDLLTARRDEVPEWLAEVPSLNSSNTRFKNVAVHFMPHLEEPVAAEKRRQANRRHSATSRHFILPNPRPIAAEPEASQPEAIQIYDDDDFDLTPNNVSSTLPFVYDLTQDD